MKHLIRFLIGLVPTSLIVLLGILHYFSLWIYLGAVICALIYPAGWLLGKILFPADTR